MTSYSLELGLTENVEPGPCSPVLYSQLLKKMVRKPGNPLEQEIVKAKLVCPRSQTNDPRFLKVMPPSASRWRNSVTC